MDMTSLLEALNSNRDDLMRNRENARKMFGDEMEKKMYQAATQAAKQLSEETTTPGKVTEIQELEESDDEPPDSDVGATSVISSLQLLYQSCRARILHVAEKISPHHDPEAVLHPEWKKFHLPDEDSWDFRLGDKVRIKLPMPEFKIVQKQVSGWNPKLRLVQGHVGIIKRLRSPYENDIGLFFPKIHTQCSLYAGVLEKVETSDFLDFEGGSEAGGWKVGDFVTTQSDQKLLKILQTGLPSVPTEWIGKRGQVLGVTPECVLVTFDGIGSCEINAALLILSTDETPIVKKEIKHPKGFQIGDKLKMIKNMKKLIKNQKGHGGWNSSMSSLRGQEVTVVDIQRDGTLLVHKEHDREWSVHPASILKQRQKEKHDEDLPFLPGDVVRIKMPRAIHEMLEDAGIPLIFIDYLRLDSTVGDIRDNLNPYLRFGNWRNTEMSNSLLCQSSYAQKEKFLEAKQKIENLKAGDNVFLDVGPPNLVTTVLKESKKGEVLIKALTSCSKLVGFLDNGCAVIEYDDGTRCKVKKQFLSVPGRFFTKEIKGGIDFDIYRQIQDAIEECLRNAHDVEDSSYKSPKVETVNIFHANPPQVDIAINTAIAKHEEIAEWLRENRKWDVKICAGQLLVKGDFGKIGINLLQDGAECKVFKDSGAISEEVERISETGTCEVEADPEMNDEPTAEELSRRQFRYIRLFDPRIGRDVYFPYVVLEPQHTIAEQQLEPDAGAGAVNQTFNIVDSNVHTISNNP